MSAVAEVDGRVAGFLLGWVGESEFGIAGATAWIDLVGVDPAYRGRGVARALLDRFVRGGQELRAIGKVATLVDLTQADVRKFFVGAGFRTGPMVQLQRDLSPGRTGPRAL
jgi:GNAT superfamily N-acetyltransferase